MKHKNRTYFWPPARLLADVAGIEIGRLYRYIKALKDGGCNK